MNYQLGAASLGPSPQCDGGEARGGGSRGSLVARGVTHLSLPLPLYFHCLLASFLPSLLSFLTRRLLMPRLAAASSFWQLHVLFHPFFVFLLFMLPCAFFTSFCWPLNRYFLKPHTRSSFALLVDSRSPHPFLYSPFLLRSSFLRALSFLLC